MLHAEETTPDERLTSRDWAIYAVLLAVLAFNATVFVVILANR